MNMLAERMSIAKRALEVNNRQRLLAKARAARADHAPLPSRGIDSPNDEFSTPKNEDRLVGCVQWGDWSFYFSDF